MASKSLITDKMLENPYMLDYFRSMSNRMIYLCDRCIKQETPIPDWVNQRRSEMMIKRVNIL